MDNPLTTHHSCWPQHDSDHETGTLYQQYPALNEEHETEVAIIGGGITGLSTALELLKRGYQVSVFEAGVIGSGTTGGSSGHLDAHPEMGPVQLIRQLGLEKAKQYVNLRLSAIQAIEERAGEASEFRRVPAYYYTENRNHRNHIQQECEAAVEIGLIAVQEPNVPLRYAESGYRISGMARMNSLAYVQELAQKVVELGGQIFEQTYVETPTDSHPTVLQAAGHLVHFKQVVCAVHFNSTSPLRIDMQIPPYQSYLLAAEVAELPPDALYWDDQDPYFYTRWFRNKEQKILLIGGCDHRTGSGNPIQAFQDLEAYARKHFDIVKEICRWSAELFEPTDGLPMIGEVPGQKGMWVATGFGGIGLTWGTAAGWLIADQIQGRKTPLQEELAPGRIGVHGLASLVSEQMPVVSSYSERILPAERIDRLTLQPGEGKVGQVDGEFSAICRDPQGCEHRVSPICTHMGGVLRWNAAEQTWDCPVHGGRFTADGQRIYGPPRSNLQNLEQPADVSTET